MIKLFELIKKNFKLLVRSKASSLVIFIGPLLLVFLLGIAYSQSSSFTLTASVYSDSYSELSESLIIKMTNQNFKVTKLDSLDDCISSVKRVESQACIIFPPDMAIRDDESNEIKFYVDYSQINLVWLMLDVMSARVSERSDEISKDLTADLLSRLGFVEERIRAGQITLESLSSSSTKITDASSSMKTGVTGLDISVDFSGINIIDSQNRSDEIDAVIDGIAADISELMNDTEDAINSIESSAASIESGINDSDILAEAEDIDDAANDIQDALDNATESIGEYTDNASDHIAEISAAFDAIGAKISDTKSKIDGVKKQRDELLPQFDSISSEIESITANVNIMRSTLDEGMQKIAAVSSKDPDSIVSPITTKIEPITTQNTHFNSLFPTLMVLIIMITGILLTATLVSVEKKSKAFFRNSFTPTSYFTFNISTYITSLIVLFIQLLLFVSVSAFFFETEVLASIWLILLLIFLASTVFIFIGMLIGFIFKTEETVNLAAITLVAVFLLFSSAVIPLESLPSYLKDIVMFNPFVISELALKQATIFQFGISKVVNGLGMLTAYAVVIFLILLGLQNAFRKLSFMHFERIHLGKSFTKEKNARAELAKPSIPEKTPEKNPEKKDVMVESKVIDDKIEVKKEKKDDDLKKGQV